MIPLKIIIVTSTEDVASLTIQKELLIHYPFNQIDPKTFNYPELVQKCYQFNFSNSTFSVDFTLWEVAVRMTRIDEYLRSEDLPFDLLIFASRHRAQSGTTALLCHTPGNWGSEAEVGGKPHMISKGSGVLQFYFFTFLSRYVKEQDFPHPVDQEVTHHGPSLLSIPLGFIELGSSEADWGNQVGGKIVADAIISSGKEIARLHFRNGQIDKDKIKVCVGFGGTHYMPNFSRLIPQGYSFPHVIPKYAIMHLTPDLIKHIIDRVLEPIDYWVVDWKGLNSAEKNHLMPLLEQTHIPIKKTKDLE
jgi:D-aminoacyl-tRNA deacylase